MLVIPGFFIVFECFSEYHSAIHSWSPGSRRNRHCAIPRSDFQLSPFLWPPYLLFHFKHILPTLNSPLKWHRALSEVVGQLCFVNKPGYLLLAFFIPSEMGDSIFRLCLRSTHSVSSRYQRQMTELFWGTQKVVPEVNMRGFQSSLLERKLPISHFTMIFRALISKTFIFLSLWGEMKSFHHQLRFSFIILKFRCRRWDDSLQQITILAMSLCFQVPCSENLLIYFTEKTGQPLQPPLVGYNFGFYPVPSMCSYLMLAWVVQIPNLLTFFSLSFLIWFCTIQLLNRIYRIHNCLCH